MNLLSRDKSNKQEVLNRYPVQGLFHFKESNGSEKTRIHLRIDPDGSGLLIVNANQVFHLNPSATHMAYYSLSKTPVKESIRLLSKAFEVSSKELLKDFQDFENSLKLLVNNEACPICDLDLETTAPFSSRPTAPYRMDLAITYRCNNDCHHCYNARVRSFPELDTSQWFTILDKLWLLGIPHIVFTGGEPTLRADLPELIRYAENNGQITGLNTNGRRLKDKDYLHSLIDAGLDHVQITLESHAPEIHDLMVNHHNAWQETVEGIRNVLETRLYVMTNTTMLSHNQQTIPDTLEFLGKLGMPTVGLNALIYSGKGKTVGTGLMESELEPLLTQAKEITSRYGQKLIWYTPTQYCNFDPVQMELGVKGCTAALFNMCIEPDGSVLPCQSYYQSLGNILSEDWQSIWNHDLAVSLRERKLLPKKCSSCLIYQDCGGGCPLQFSDD